MDNLFAQLTPGQALAVVRQLSEREGDIRPAVTEETKRFLEAVDRDETAEEVFYVLDIIDVQDLWDTSGAGSGGYLSPDEAVAEIVESELKPFFDQVERYQQLRMFPQAQTHCMGVLQGIYRFNEESRSEFRQWAEDIPLECFRDFLDKWRRGGEVANSATDMNEFIRQSCPNWAKYVITDSDPRT